MQVNVDHNEYIIEVVSDYMVAVKDFSVNKIVELVNIMLKNFEIRTIQENNETPFWALKLDVIEQVLIKKGESEGFNGIDYKCGIQGFDSSGNCIRDWVINVSDIKDHAARSFDAGRKYARQGNEWAKLIKEIY